MANQVKRVNYCYVTVPSRAGQAVKVLQGLKTAGVNLQAFSGFPVKGGMSQIDLVSNDMAGIKRAAKQGGWELSKVKRGFLVQGNDTVGAVHRVLSRLAEKKINVTAVDAAAAGQGRYGMILWVKPKDYGRAARALNAK